MSTRASDESPVPELTPQERRRIYEEERSRLEARPSRSRVTPSLSHHGAPPASLMMRILAWVLDHDPYDMYVLFMTILFLLAALVSVLYEAFAIR
jgi:hypothetical protein